MGISFLCGECERKLVAKEKYAGGQKKCPACGAVVVVPMPEDKEASQSLSAEEPKADTTSSANDENDQTSGGPSVETGAATTEESTQEAPAVDVPAEGDIKRTIQEVLEFVDLTGGQAPSCETLVKAGDKAVPLILDAIATLQPGEPRSTFESKARLCETLGEIGTQQAKEALHQILDMHANVWEHTSIVKPAAQKALAGVDQSADQHSSFIDAPEVPSRLRSTLLFLLQMLHFLAWKIPSYIVAGLLYVGLQGSNVSEEEAWKGARGIAGAIFIPLGLWLPALAYLSLMDGPLEETMTPLLCAIFLLLAMGWIATWYDFSLDSATPSEQAPGSHCRFWYCSSCNAVFEKDLERLQLFKVEGEGEVIIRGTWECDNCHAVYQSADVYAGKHDPPQQHWPEIEQSTGKSALVEL